MKTYGDAAALLHTFLSASPDPGSIGTGATPKDKLYRALTANTGCFSPTQPAPPTPGEKPADATGVAAPVELAVPWRDAECARAGVCNHVSPEA